MKRTFHAERRARLSHAVKKAGLEALLIAHPPNITYLTGFTGDSSYLLLGPKVQLMISDSRFETQLSYECPELNLAIRTSRNSLSEFLGRQIGKLHLQRVGFEADYITVSTYSALVEHCGRSVELVAQRGLVEALRQIKDHQEIAAIRRAIGLAERGLHATWVRVLPELTERQTAHELEHEMRRFGALRAAFDPIIGVGPQSALPHYRAGHHHLSEAAFVLIDWGAVEPTGYHSDLTRVLATSKIPPKLEKLYRVVLQARNAALDRMRPGEPCREVDASARNVIEQAGYGKYFGHGLGHGIGLEIHEAPRLSPISQDVLRAGMVVTVEPGIYLPGFGGVRLEDDVLITRDGCDVLSTYSLELKGHP